MIVMKFGGSSVADATRMAHVAGLVVAHDGPVAVVTSALGGTTDALLEAGRCAERGDLDAALAVADAIEARHRQAAGEDLELEAIIPLGVELRDVLRGVRLLGEQTPRSRATLASLGERLAVPLLAGAIRRAGRTAIPVDARRVIVTDDHHEEGVVDEEASRARVHEVVTPLLDGGAVPVITGFLGATPQGVTTVLGRGGSDYTASLLGSMLAADEIWIWTDVDGILTADPRIVRDARTLEQVSFREAAEMSYFGAKVVHPKTMLPAMAAGIPIRIRSTFQPDRPGTRVAADAEDVPLGVKVVTAVRHQALITLEGRGMAGLPGVARRIFSCAERVDANVVMISQASSEQTVSLVVSRADAESLVGALSSDFALEIAAGLVEPPRVRDDVAVISAVGEGMAGHPGISGRMFQALGRSGVNVLAIAQGGSELSISATVDETDVARAVRAVHQTFGLTRRVDVVVLGAGRVASAFLKMLARTRPGLADSHHLDLRVLGVATSSRWIHDEDGLDPVEAVAAVRAGDPRLGDDALLDLVEALRHGPVVLVDLTAADVTALHREALDRAFHVVTANKLPLSGSMSSYRTLIEAVKRTGARYGYETTFGAGLPVLHTLQELLHTGDEVASVEGCFSGTLGFLCTCLQDGLPLVEAVARAEAEGYTEPDPREDLSGRDVARKALIVARAIGLDLEPTDVVLEPFVPDLADGLDTALARHGAAFAQRVRDAAERGSVLRYVATITPQQVQVGLHEVPAASPIGALRGPDNILVFRTARYRDYPLVVQGPGAGAEVTAAGVLGDVIRIASGVE